MQREYEGWNQTEVSRRLAAYGFTMHQSTVAKLESGTRPIRLNEVAALAQVFGLKLDELIAPLYPEVEADVAGDQLRRAREQLAAADEQLHAAERDAEAADEALKEAKERFHQAHAERTFAQMWLEDCQARYEQQAAHTEDEGDGEHQQEA